MRSLEDTSRQADRSELALFSCKPGSPGVIEEAIGTLALACSYRRYPASGRDQRIFVGLVRRHVLSFLFVGCLSTLASSAFPSLLPTIVVANVFFVEMHS